MKKRILLVDDDHVASKFIGSGLGHLGYEFEWVSSGKEAIQRLQDPNGPEIDVVLLDQLMKEMDGLGTFRKMKELDLGVPTIMVTAFSSVTLAVEFLKAGGDDYVEKPILDFDIIGIKIERAIERAKACRILEEREAMERAFEFKSAFITRASHDMRSPFFGIATCIEAALATLNAAADKPDNVEKAIHVLRTAQKSAIQITKLLNDTLDLAKLEAGKFEYSFREASLADVISESVSAAEFLEEETGVSVTFLPPTGKSVLSIDPGAMGQVFSNLIGNAVKFSEAGDRVCVSLMETEGSVTVSVSDEGVGIPKDEVPIIFDRFARSARVQRKKEGTGLGLSICQEIVIAHGGTIWAQNNPSGKGATFYVQIPKKRGDS